MIVILSPQLSTRMRKKEISEQFGEHRQSILSTIESLTESKEPASSSLLKFTEDFHLQPSISELGTLNECTHKPGAVFMEVKRVVVRHDDDDVYFDYPFTTDEGGTYVYSTQEVIPNVPSAAMTDEGLYEDIQADIPESPPLQKPPVPTIQPPKPRPQKRPP